MKVLAIIVLYNAEKNDWIYKCLNSLAKSTLTCDIIAIDNLSTDKTCNIVEEDFPFVKLIKNEENLGFGQANNIGLKKVIDEDYDYAFLLNQDAWVEPDTIEKLVKQAELNPDYGIISPLHLNGVGDKLDYIFSLYIAPQNCKNLFSDFTLHREMDKIYENYMVCAACWLVSKKCINRVGGFSPTFFHYAEDDNYCHRLHFKNLKIGVYPFAKIFHDRENRPANSFEEQPIATERGLLLTYSNPFRKTSVGKRLQQLRTQRLIKFLKWELKSVKMIDQERAVLKKYEKMIEDNIHLSTSTKENIFLT